MPQLTQAEDDYRNQIADTLTPPVAPNTAASRIASAIPTNLSKQFTTGMPAGMPQTPAGGVPGSGLAPAGPSTVQLPNAPRSSGGPMQSITPQQPQMGGFGQPLQLPNMPAQPDVPPAPYGLSQAPGMDQAPGLGGAAPQMRNMRSGRGFGRRGY